MTSSKNMSVVSMRVIVRIARGSVIYIGPVANLDDVYGNNLVLNLGQDPVIADTVPPFAGMVSMKRLPRSPGIAAPFKILADP